MLELAIAAAVFAAALLLGWLLIRRVPALLHTPLMSMTNAISAVTVLGALVLFAVPRTTLPQVLAGAALVLAMFNVVGGFAITERMLRLFRRRSTRP